MSLQGRVAVVTGSGRNIGRATALALARDGARVVVNAKSNREEAEAVAREAEEMGAEALVALTDVADEAQVDRMFRQVLERWGRVDILVNNASIRPHKPFLETTTREWREVLGVDLDGAFFCTRAAIPSMVENHWGRVIFMSADGTFNGAPMRVHIAAAKMALVGMARSLATEFAANNITVNVLSPSKINTTRIRSWYPDPDKLDDTTGIPVGRFGDPREVAAACVFLASEEAAYITGQTIHVNGGSDYF
jgi:3-oxoacyl-[acyl-carrier protein] reductase